MMNRTLAVAMLAAGLSANAALADDDCEAPMARWQPREAMQARVEAQGWQVRRIRTDDGCYKVYARDARGNAIEARFDPETLDIRRLEVEFKRGGTLGDLVGDADAARREPAATAPEPAEVPAPAQPNGGILRSAPRAVVE